LIFSTKALRLEMPDAKRERLMQAYLALRPWPDVLPALKSMKEAGLRLALLSNFTHAMLKSNVENSGMEGMFEHLLSSDQTRTYKPDPRAYQLAIDAMKLRREEILFAAFAGWDAAGAKSFGYRTFWVNRQALPVEELGAPPDGIGATLADLVDFLHI
jgi:2-haloacid dehalogenase